MNMYISTGNVIKQLILAFIAVHYWVMQQLRSLNSTQEARLALTLPPSSSNFSRTPKLDDARQSMNQLLINRQLISYTWLYLFGLIWVAVVQLHLLHCDHLSHVCESAPNLIQRKTKITKYSSKWKMIIAINFQFKQLERRSLTK